jgi:hypothetical protein|tara:strand:- start:36 stop:557 length:522 start_codon:yes stop_codon:yes gene_type:complete
MIYTTPTKGEDGLYFVKVLNDDKRKCLVQLNKVKVTDVSGDVAVDIVSDVNTQRIEGIDTRNLEAALENCESWFGKKLSESVIKGAYTSALDSGTMTCDRLDVTKVFNAQQGAVDFDTLQPEKTCDVILEFAGLWFAKKAFGPTWNVVQVRVHDDPIIDTYPAEYAFVDEDDQ